MGAGLVGDDVRLEAHPLERRQRVGRVGDESDAERAPLALRRPAAGDRVLEVVRLLVEVAGLDAPPQVAGVDLDAERDAAVHRDRRAAAPRPCRRGLRSARSCPRASRRSGAGRSPRSTRRCPGRSPGSRCRSRTRRSSGRTSSAPPPRGGGTRPSCPTRRPGSSWRSGRAATTRGCGRRPTGLPDWTSRVSSSPSSRSDRTIASKASQERAARPVPP